MTSRPRARPAAKAAAKPAAQPVTAAEAELETRAEADPLPVPNERLERLVAAIGENEALNEKLRRRLVQLDERPDDAGAKQRLFELTREEVAIEMNEGHPSTLAKAVREFRAEHAEERAALLAKIEEAQDETRQRMRRTAIEHEIRALVEQQIDAVDSFERELRAAFDACLASATAERRAYGAALSRVTGAIQALAALAPLPVYVDGTAPQQMPQAHPALRSVADNPQSDQAAEHAAREALTQALGEHALRGFRYLIEKPLKATREREFERVSYRVPRTQTRGG